MTIQEAIKVLENVVTFDYTEEVEAIDVVLKALAELKESKKEGKWKPVDGEQYFFADAYGEMASNHWREDEYDKEVYKRQPLFKTKEACERYWHFMDTVKEKSYEFTADEWKNGEIEKLYITYNYTDDVLYIDNTWYYRDLGKIYFKTEEDAKYIIDNFKEELMEYFVEER